MDIIIFPVQHSGFHWNDDIVNAKKFNLDTLIISFFANILWLISIGNSTAKLFYSHDHDHHMYIKGHISVMTCISYVPHVKIIFCAKSIVLLLSKASDGEIACNLIIL